MPRPAAQPSAFAGVMKVLASEAAKPRFKMGDVLLGATKALEQAGMAVVLAPLDRLKPSTRKHVFRALLRHCFFIEAVNDDITSTKMEVRWTPRLEGDPRRQAFDECWNIFVELLDGLRRASADNVALLDGVAEHSLVAYELPLDYVKRVKGEPIHTQDNLRWWWDGPLREVIELRKTLTSRDENPNADVFGKVLDQKIQVKTYLTDRVQTGDYKTNREKRWECHPNSVHFALRRDCWLIEGKLLKRVCHFDGFPEPVFGKLEAKGVVAAAPTARCAVTQERLSYKKFVEEVQKPEHGEAEFQVGHLNPLKGAVGDPRFMHTAENIDWVSKDGNRIQGSLTLEHVRNLLARIPENYNEAGVKLA